MKIPVLTLDIPTQNKRIYPKNIIEKEINRLNNTLIKENKFLVMGHAPTSETINLLSCVGVVKDIYIQDNVLFVDIEFLTTNNGKFLESLFHTGNAFLSVYGLGHLNKLDNGLFVIDDDYHITGLYVEITNK